jgi:pilus assembly protein CpaF
MSTAAEPAPVVPPSSLLPPVRRDALSRRFLEQLTQRLDLNALQNMPEERRRGELRPLIDALIDRDASELSTLDREEIAGDLLDDLLALGPLEKLLRDDSVGDILVNGPHETYIERHGRLEEVPVHFRDSEHLLQIIERIAARVGRRIDDSSPMLDARLPDGSRVNAIIPPLALRGPTLSIRRFGTKPLGLEELLHLQAMTPEMAKFLEGAVKAKLNIIVSGGTGSGKTTLLNSLSSFIPEGDRIVTIEDAAELRLQQRHVVPLETRPPNVDGKGGVNTRDLMRNALRMRPDRVVIGECRGAEALDMLQAMNSGHEGSLTTLHANTPRDALTRLETMMLMAGFEIPLKALRRQITSAINLIVQAERLQGGARKVTSVTEVVGMEGDVIVSQEVFVFQQVGVNSDGKALGQFQTTGVRPKSMLRLNACGIDFPGNMFMQRVLLRT